MIIKNLPSETPEDHSQVEENEHLWGRGPSSWDRKPAEGGGGNHDGLARRATVRTVCNTRLAHLTGERVSRTAEG